MCVHCTLYIRKFKLSDVGNPAKYRAHGSCHTFIDFCSFGLCVGERKVTVKCEDSIGQLCATPFWHRFVENQRWSLEMVRASCIMQRHAVPPTPSLLRVHPSHVDYGNAILTEVVCKVGVI